MDKNGQFVVEDNQSWTVSKIWHRFLHKLSKTIPFEATNLMCFQSELSLKKNIFQMNSINSKRFITRGCNSCLCRRILWTATGRRSPGSWGPAASTAARPPWRRFRSKKRPSGVAEAEKSASSLSWNWIHLHVNRH